MIAAPSADGNNADGQPAHQKQSSDRSGGKGGPAEVHRGQARPSRKDTTMPTIATTDGTEIYYKDWGQGPAVVLSHGWPLSSDSWEAQMLFLASNGYRCIAHDRRGHGRSSQTWDGNDMDTYADDLADLIDALDLRDIALIGFSTGGGEVTRYIGTHGTGPGGGQHRTGGRDPRDPRELPADLWGAARVRPASPQRAPGRPPPGGPPHADRRPGRRACPASLA
jgi:non-heme chloroperoxidase